MHYYSQHTLPAPIPVLSFLVPLPRLNLEVVSKKAPGVSKDKKKLTGRTSDKKAPQVTTVHGMNHAVTVFIQNTAPLSSHSQLMPLLTKGQACYLHV